MMASFVGLAGGDNQLEDAIVGRKVGIVYKIVDRRGLLGIPSGHTLVQPNNGNHRGRQGGGGRARL